MKTLKKLFSVSAIVALLGTLAPMYAFGAGNSLDLDSEFPAAYAYAYANGITTQSEDNVDMGGKLTRIALAKMVAKYAINVLKLTPDTSKTCTFTDVTAALDAQYDNGVTQACQLGLMGVNITAFRPNDLVTRGEFGTTFSRALNANSDNLAAMNAADPYYKEHLNYLNKEGIMKVIDPNMLEVRGYVMLMMMRSDESYTAVEGCTAEELLACFNADDYDACIAACSDEEPAEEEPTDPEEVKAGTLNVTASYKEGGEFPSLVSSLPVATYTLKAVDEDVNVTSFVIEKGGYAAAGSKLSAALYINGARVSKVKDLTSVDTEVTLGLTSDYTIKAGKSVDVELRVADVRDAAGADQFNIKLDEINCSAEKVKLPSNVKSNTFKLVATATVDFAIDYKNPLDAPKAGTKNADLFEFALIGSSAQDIVLNSITLLADNKDVAEYFDNFELTLDDEVLAKGTMNGKYLTFTLKNGYTFDKNKTATKTFTVKADANGGAGKGPFKFYVENSMDIIATANGYNASVRVIDHDTDDVINSANKKELAPFSVSAGRVTIERENPKTTTFVKNQSNVYLGSFTINDNNGSDISLNGFELRLAEKSAYTMNNYLEGIKVRYGSTTAGFVQPESVAGNVYTFEDEKTIGKSLTVYVYATLQNNKNVVKTDVNPNQAGSFQMELSSISLKENQNDTPVEDKSMPGLWTAMKGTVSRLTLTNVSLGAKSVAEGTSDIDAVSFKVRTNETDGVKMSKLTFVASDALHYGTCNVSTCGTLDNEVCETKTACELEDAGVWTPINNNTIRRAVLVAGDNEYSATVAAGEIRVNNANILLDANTTTTFTLKVDLAGNPSVKTFAYKLSSYEAEDTSADRNEMNDSPSGINGRVITAQGNGQLSISMENTDNNKYNKSILAGTSSAIAEISLQAKYETINANTIDLEFSQGIANKVNDIELYYGDTMIASNPIFDGVQATFTNVDLDISLTKTPLTVKLITKVMNEDNGFNYVKDVTLNNITFSDVIGNDTGNPITNTLDYDTTIVRKFDIVPATLVATSTNNGAKTTIEFALNKGDNTWTDGSDLVYKLEDIALDITQNGLNNITIKNEDNQPLYTTKTFVDTYYTTVAEYNTAHSTSLTQEQFNDLTQNEKLKATAAANCTADDDTTYCWVNGSTQYGLVKGSDALDWTISDGTKLTVSYAGDTTDSTYTVDLTDVIYGTHDVEFSSRAHAALTLISK